MPQACHQLQAACPATLAARTTGQTCNLFLLLCGYQQDGCCPQILRGVAAWPQAITALCVNAVFTYDRQMVLKSEALPADKLTAEQKALHGLSDIGSMAQHGL